MLRIAAIDVGSNAIRLAIGGIRPDKSVKVIENYREGVRLGLDVFEHGTISASTIDRAVLAFKRFREHIEYHGVKYFQSVATSAAREASNNATLLEEVRKRAGVELRIIDGQEEARLVFQAVSNQINFESGPGLIIDIGGGSTELILCKSGILHASISCAIGTVRLLNKMPNAKIQTLTADNSGLEVFQRDLKSFLDQNLDSPLQTCVGTGGNAEAFLKLKKRLLKVEGQEYVTTTELQRLLDQLSALSYDARVSELKLKPDRADVIIPAGMLLLSSLRTAGIDTLLIPRVGLKDGLLLDLANKISSGVEVQ